jgi:cobyrinic acid a,c-diamide synthase
MNKQRNRIVIAGTGSGAGKTTVSIGLMAAFRRRGYSVQGFKCGPDYIDPTYHTAVTGRTSRNLDTWMLPADTMKEIFIRGSEGAELSIIEGVMGMYDGKDPLSNTGSTAEIAMLLDAPVLLVVNVGSMARSAAAIVYGFQHMDERIRIAGVIANKCGSAGHYQLVKAAIEQECGIPVVGWLGRDEALDIPERHLGLVPAIERGELNPLFERAADRIEQGVDLDRVLELAASAPAVSLPEASLFVMQTGGGTQRMDPIHLAIARDAAFNFYYQENLELLEQRGARITYFSPLAGESVPKDADGLYLGGGFPEEFAAELSSHTDMIQDLKRRVEEGLPVFAECGGYMYLTESITDRAGNTYPMAGIIPAETRMQPKLAALGYREVRAMEDCLLLAKGEMLRGHEFHYSKLTELDLSYPHVYESKGLRGTGLEGYTKGNVMAGYTHVHFASNPGCVDRLLGQCLLYKRKREGHYG